jgi:hypothetical protein
VKKLVYGVIFTNTNLVILQQSIAGFQQVALNATTGAALAFTNAAFQTVKMQL